MAQVTDIQLTTQSDVIRNETVDGANTKGRHADMNQNIIDSKINNDKIDTANSLDTPGKSIPGIAAIKAYIAAAIGGLNNLTAEDIDTLAEINALLTDADVATVTQLNLKSNALLDYKTKTASHTLDASDLTDFQSGKALNFLMNVATANTFTIPLDSTVAFPIGFSCLVDQINAGQVTFTPIVGVTINSKNNHLKLNGQGTGAVLKKTAINTWTLQGDLTAA